MKYINNNNNLKNKYDFDEKLSDYMKKRFNNYIKKANNAADKRYYLRDERSSIKSAGWMPWH